MAELSLSNMMYRINLAFGILRSNDICLNSCFALSICLKHSYGHLLSSRESDVMISEAVVQRLMLPVRIPRHRNKTVMIVSVKKK